MKKTGFYVISITLVAAIGGLIFGFDTAIVAGATRYMKEEFALGSLQEGWAVSVVLIIKIRGSAMGLATLVLWLADFVVTLTFPVISDKFHPSTAFWLYAAMCALDLVFIWLFLPETKGKSLEEIERHWLKTA